MSVFQFLRRIDLGYTRYENNEDSPSDVDRPVEIANNLKDDVDRPVDIANNLKDS